VEKEIIHQNLKIRELLLRFKISLFLLFFLFINGCSSSGINDLNQFVNSFIGTSGGGNTFPGALVPWGMVSVSPHTDLKAPSGYIHGEPYFYGFGQVHLSGTGCADLGSVIITVTRGEVKTEPEQYRCSYQNEQAKPGYYAVNLNEPDVKVEVTATTRCSFSQFTIGKEGNVNILIDAGRSLVERQGGSVRFVSPTEIEGYNRSGGLCGEDNQHQVYFVTRVSATPQKFGTWIDDQVSEDISRASDESSIGAWMTFTCQNGQIVNIKTGISYVSIANARQNLDAEITDWNFDKIGRNAEREWRKQLSKIKVEGGSEAGLTKFYTALYHCLIHPNIISDVNGEFPLMGQTGVGKYTDRERYSVFSLWDTYRTLHPLLTLIYPEQQSAIIRTMIDMYSESGFLPKWELAGNETYMMVGDPAPIVIADSYLKGIQDFDPDLALEAMLKPTLLDSGESAPPIRAGYHELLKYGYIPFEQDTSQAWWVWGPVSTTLEYCLSDFCIGNMANMLGQNQIAEEFGKRASFYRNLFDPETRFMRPKLRNGQWLEPFDPLATEGSGYWEGSGGPGYVEGNAWNYTWFVPHDVSGLIDLFGGYEPFKIKLEQCFSEGHFTITNEPDIAYPYLFSYIPGNEYRTAELVQEILASDFGTESDGLPGNDDAGAIAAWLVFSALGFYPACPAVDEYRLGIPLFQKVTIELDKEYYSGKQIVIEKSGKLVNSARLKEILFDGERWDSFGITHKRLTEGAHLKFVYNQE